MEVTYITIVCKCLSHQMVVCCMIFFIAVHNTVQIRKVSVQVNALGIFTSSGPAFASILAT